MDNGLPGKQQVIQSLLYAVPSAKVSSATDTPPRSVWDMMLYTTIYNMTVCNIVSLFMALCDHLIVFKYIFIAISIVVTILLPE